MYHQRLNVDLAFGLASEQTEKSKIENHLNCNLVKTGDYCSVDWVDSEKRINVELKTRRVSSTTYPTSMVPLSKFKYMLRDIIKNNSTAYVFVKFTDGLFCYDVKNNCVKKEWVQSAGRTDRGQIEINKYVMIPMEKFVRV